MNERVRALLQKYDDELSRYTLRRVEDAAEGNSLGHLRWMIREMLDHGDDWSDRKTNRWLGFIQGTLWQSGVIGILKLRDQTRDLYAEEVTEA